jgi:tetratricopeptide repeat protein
MRHVAAVTALVFVLMMGSGPAAKGTDAIDGANAVAVARWVAAVRSHTPGRRDAATVQISALTFANRIELNGGIGLFFAALRKGVPTQNDAEKQIVARAREVIQSPGTEIFLKRAAVLHGDTALQNQVDDPLPDPLAGALPPETPATPLLSRQRLFLNKDGEIHGEVFADWNWPFARSLLDLIEPKPADDPFVATWYHATTAFMLQKGLYGEVITHLERAAAVLPDDARVLFDRASYSEIQGLPLSQVLLSDSDLLALRAQHQGRASAIRTPTAKPLPLGIPPPEVANSEAERLFRRALRADPSLIEARVRLARLLDARGKHEEAAAELTTALAEKPAGHVAFYAQLFAGRVAQALGQIEDAAAHYRDATKLFPGAQSARLAQSQIALLAADVPASLEAIQHLDKSITARDPWWQYHLAAGRDANELLRAMWAAVLKF